MGMLCFIVFLSFIIGAVAACIYAIGTGTKKGKAEKKQRKQDKENGIKRFPALEHVEGLDVAKKSPCTVILSPSNMVISCTGKEYTLPLRRIMYAEFIVDVDKIRYLQSSMAKGAVGAAIFGVSGAVIGAAPKTKVAYEKVGYAVVGYRDAKGSERIIILKDQTVNSYVCRWLVDELESCTHTTIEKVEL